MKKMKSIPQSKLLRLKNESLKNPRKELSDILLPKSSTSKKRSSSNDVLLKLRYGTQ